MQFNKFEMKIQQITKSNIDQKENYQLQEQMEIADKEYCLIGFWLGLN